MGSNARRLRRRGAPSKKTPAHIRLALVTANIQSRGTGLALARITEGPWEPSVIVAVTGFPLEAGVTEEGVMLQVMPGGREEAAGQDSATVPVKPRLGVTVIMALPGWPAVKARVAGVLATVKSGVPMFIVTDPGETLPL